jgi:hypothetical protein
VLEETFAALAQVEYPEFEIRAINDGSRAIAREKSLKAWPLAFHKCGRFT